MEERLTNLVTRRKLVCGAAVTVLFPTYANANVQDATITSYNRYQDGIDEQLAKVQQLAGQNVGPFSVQVMQDSDRYISQEYPVPDFSHVLYSDSMEGPYEKYAIFFKWSPNYTDYVASFHFFNTATGRGNSSFINGPILYVICLLSSDLLSSGYSVADVRAGIWPTWTDKLFFGGFATQADGFNQVHVYRSMRSQFEVRYTADWSGLPVAYGKITDLGSGFWRQYTIPLA